MALLNVITARQPLVNSKNEPVRGGNVFLYEPGTTTFITGYRDSGLVTPHPNPIPISGSGRVNIWISRNCDLRVENKQGNLITEELSVNPETLGQDEAGGLLANGSFEIDTNADNIPDSWVLVSEPNSNNQIDTTESTDGAQSFRFTSAGQGGGSLTTENFFPVNDVDTLRINFDIRSTIATVQNIVRVEWFDISQVAISNSTIYDSTANPVTFTSQNLTANPPTNARFAKLRLIGCDPAVVVPGSTYFDRVSVFYPALVTGVFDNITVQNNEIISTNTNGNINIVPNGTGAVRLSHNGAPKVLTQSSGVVVRGSIDGAVGAAQNATIQFQNLSGTNIGFISYNNATSLSLVNQNNGGLLVLQGNDSAGTLQNFIFGNPQLEGVGNPGVSSNLLRLTSTADASSSSTTHGFQIGSSGGANLIMDTNEVMARLNGSTASLIINGDGGDIQIGSVSGANVTIGSTTETSIRRAGGLTKLITRSEGISVLGSLSNTPASGNDQNAALALSNSAGALVGAIRYSTARDLRIDNLTFGGDLIGSAVDAGGVSRITYRGNPDGAFSQHHLGAEVTSTTTAALGGLLVNNDLTGGGFERALTVGDLPLTAVTTSTLTRVSTITVTDDPVLAHSSIPTGIYKIDAFIKWEGAVNVFLRYLFNVTGVNGITDALHTYTVDAGSGERAIEGGFLTLQSLVNLGPNPTDPQSRQGIHIVGTIDFSSVGSIAFAWAQSVSSAQDMDRLANSYLILTRLGNTA